DEIEILPSFRLGRIRSTIFSFLPLWKMVSQALLSLRVSLPHSCFSMALSSWMHPSLSWTRPLQEYALLWRGSFSTLERQTPLLYRFFFHPRRFYPQDCYACVHLPFRLQPMPQISPP